jgi:hypothetical protein
VGDSPESSICRVDKALKGHPFEDRKDFNRLKSNVFGQVRNRVSSPRVAAISPGSYACWLGRDFHACRWARTHADLTQILQLQEAEGVTYGTVNFPGDALSHLRGPTTISCRCRVSKLNGLPNSENAE